MGRNVLKASPNRSDFNLDVSNLNKGVYMVDLKSAGKTTTIKVVKKIIIIKHTNQKSPPTGGFFLRYLH